MSLVHSAKKSLSDVFSVVSSTTNVISKVFDAGSKYSEALHINAHNYVLVAETLAPMRAKLAIEEETNVLAHQFTETKLELKEKFKNQNYANVYTEALSFLQS